MNKQTENQLTILNTIGKLQNKISKQQKFMLVRELSLLGIDGQQALLDLLIDRRLQNKLQLEYIDSIIFEFLFSSDYLSITEALNHYFPHGLVDLAASQKVAYQPLQNLLIMHRYQEADKLTQLQLCQLAGLDTLKTRDWLYFTDIPFLPSEDLITIDTLWQMYSREKFGFSRQRHIWLLNNRNWEKFWHQIDWKNNGVPKRYPDEFLWNINAPVGHLPLFNQLRGVQVLSALFNHMAWNKINKC